MPIMRQFVLGLAVAAMTLPALVVPALAGKQDFTIVNRTGYTINEIYISSSKTNDWEEDVMGRDALGDGESVDIEFERGENQCKWDMMAVYDDGEEAVWENLNLCQISKVTLKYNNKTRTTTAVVE